MLTLLCGAIILCGCGPTVHQGGTVDPYYVGELRNDPAASYNRTALPDRTQPGLCECGH
jgi:hypothetical protein